MATSPKKKEEDPNEDLKTRVNNLEARFGQVKDGHEKLKGQVDAIAQTVEELL